MTRKAQELDRCDCQVIHEDIVNQVLPQMPPEETLYDLAELFKVLGIPLELKFYGL